MIQLIPNWKQSYKFYVVILGVAVAIFNWLAVNQDAVKELIPPDKLPYWNIGFAIAGVILRNIHQPAVSTAPPETPK